MTEIQPYQVALMFVLGIIIGVSMMKLYQVVYVDRFCGTASLPSTENMTALTKLNVPHEPKSKNDVYCPVCGVLAQKEKRSDDTVLMMNFQYHCRQCYLEVFGR